MASEAELIQTISLDGFPANEVFPADIDGDGRVEMLFLQSPGIYQSDVFCGTRWEVSPENRSIFCLTAVDHRGNILWQSGTPYTESTPYSYHVADQMAWCEDLDGDGRMEIALLGRERLTILDGPTGTEIRSTPLPADNFSIIRAFSTPTGKRLLVKNTEKAYPPHWYADPTLIYDLELNLVVTLPRTLGSGHSPRAFDINGDGWDELLIGYEAFDGDGHRLWRLDAVNEEDYDPTMDHEDQIVVGSAAGETRILYAGSSQAYMASLDGRVLWQRPLGHAQHVLIGSFQGHGKRALLAFLNLVGEAHLVFMDENGEIVNIVYPPVHWPGSPEKRTLCHSGEGILLFPQGCPDGSDAIILRDFGWPTAINLVGEEVFTLPYPAKRGNPSGYEIGGEGYSLRVVDYDNDGQLEILVHDFDEAWVFKPRATRP